MHDSVMAWVQRVLDPAWVLDQDVIEAGALDVNGSVRPLVQLHRPASYIGYDIQLGAGVDLLCDAADLPAEIADLVISTEMLEHAEHWHEALIGMVAALRAGGRLLLTTRSVGFGRHDYPGDWWRFSCPQLARVLVHGCGLDLERIEPDPDFPGVFALARQPEAYIPVSLGGYAATPML